MKLAIQYGIGIAIVLAIVNSIFVDLIGVQNDFVRQFSGFSPFLILAVGLFLGMKKIKVLTYHNQLNYGHAIYSGIVLTAFTALFLSVYNFFYFQFINPDFANEIIEVTKPLMIADKLNETEIQKEINSIKESYLPINQIKGTFVMIMLVGIVFSSIYSSILRTQDAFTEVNKPRV